jgi:predicted DNA-binding transcriptional regulator AlpA
MREPDELLRERDLLSKKPGGGRFVPLGKTQFDEACKRGEFPEPISITDSGRTRAWLASEVAEWQRFRKAKRDNVFAGDWKQWWARVMEVAP